MLSIMMIRAAAAEAHMHIIIVIISPFFTFPSTHGLQNAKVAHASHTSQSHLFYFRISR